MWIAVGRSANDLAGVFEFDGETGYFYLYRYNSAPKDQILGWIHIVSGVPDFKEADVKICWTENEAIVGLFVYSVLWAAFDATRHTGFGGNYRPCNQPDIPENIGSCFY